MSMRAKLETGARAWLKLKTTQGYDRMKWVKMAQGLKPKYRDVKFLLNADFQKWLKATAVTVIEFEDCGQDFTRWYLADNCEVIHSEPFQSGVWNGTFVLDHTIGEQPVILSRFSSLTILNYKVIGVKTNAAVC